MITKYDKLRSGHCQVSLGDDIGLFKYGHHSLINAIGVIPNVQLLDILSAERFEDLRRRMTAFAESVFGKCVKAVDHMVDRAVKEKYCYADM